MKNMETRKAELFARYREQAGVPWYSPCAGPDTGDSYLDTESGLVLPRWMAMQMCITGEYVGMTGWDKEDWSIMAEYMIESMQKTPTGLLSRTPKNIAMPVPPEAIDRLAKEGWENVGGTMEEPSVWYDLQDMPAILALTGLTAMLILERPGFPCWIRRLENGICFYQIPVRTPDVSWRTAPEPPSESACMQALQIQMEGFRRTLQTVEHFSLAMKHRQEPDGRDLSLALRTQLSHCRKLPIIHMKYLMLQMEANGRISDTKDSWLACRKATGKWKPLCDTICAAIEPLAEALSW